MLNRMGLSICYKEVLRIRTRLASHAKKISQNGMIYPNHINPKLMTAVAIDNFDHNKRRISRENKTEYRRDVTSNSDEEPLLSGVDTPRYEKALHTRLYC